MSDDHRRNMQAAYLEATKRLRARHDEEFHDILAEVYAERGITVVKRRSRSQRQQDRIAEATALLAKYQINQPTEKEETHV